MISTLQYWIWPTRSNHNVLPGWSWGPAERQAVDQYSWSQTFKGRPQKHDYQIASLQVGVRHPYSDPLKKTFLDDYLNEERSSNPRTSYCSSKDKQSSRRGLRYHFLNPSRSSPLRSVRTLRLHWPLRKQKGKSFFGLADDFDAFLLLQVSKACRTLSPCASCPKRDPRA